MNEVGRISGVPNSGRTKLLELVSFATSEGVSLSTRDVVSEPSITAEDLHSAILATAAAFDLKSPQIKSDDRDVLARHLRDIIDIALNAPQSGTSKNAQLEYDDPVHYASVRSDRIAGGPGDRMSQVRLRILRHLNGWVSLGALADSIHDQEGVTPNRRHMVKVTLELRAQHRASLEEGQMSAEEAERKAQAEYIAITPRMKATWYDLSPAASQDVRARIDEYVHRIAHGVNKEYYFLRYALRPLQRNVKNMNELAERLRDEVIQRYQATDRLTRAEAEAACNQQYIAFETTSAGHRKYLFLPAAQLDMDRELQRLYPNNPPRDIVREATGQGQPAWVLRTQTSVSVGPGSRNSER